MKYLNRFTWETYWKSIHMKSGLTSSTHKQSCGLTAVFHVQIGHPTGIFINRYKLIYKLNFYRLKNCIMAVAFLSM